MTMIMTKAVYTAKKDGRQIMFVYEEQNRLLLVYVDDVYQMGIANVSPEESTKKMNLFMATWNLAAS